MRKALIFLVFLLSGLAVMQAQQCMLKGKVFDANAGEPIVYANITLLSDADTSFLSGAITNEKGVFKIDDVNPGLYRLKVSFIGYQPFMMDTIRVEEGTMDLGKIKLEVLSENLDEVNINSSKSPLSFKVDRKVIDADSYPEADVALDLLEHIPSLEVDFQGNLTYRGGGTFKVYINGRPVTNGPEKLKQLPASQIDKIEVVTNPSAQYDSEGSAGIILILLKKNRLEGYSINSSVKVGTRKSGEFLFSVDKKGKRGGWYINGNVGMYIWGENRIEQHQHIWEGENKFDNNIYRHMKYGGLSEYLEMGFNYDLSSRDYIDFSGHINPLKQTEFQYSDGNYSEYSYDKDGHYLYDPKSYTNDSRNDLFYQYAGASLSYEHAFNKKRTHLLSTYVTFSTYLRNEEEKLIEILDDDFSVERMGYISGEQNETTIDAELSYAIPFSKTVSMKAGGKLSTDHIPEIYSTSGTFNEQGEITPFDDEPANQHVVFAQDVYAGFLTLKGEWKKVAIQLGGRVEYTDRVSDYYYNDTTGTEVLVPGRTNFIDFFPSAHFTYSFSGDHQLNISYSRRIDRPRYWNLVPLRQYYSPFAFSTGNVDLLPSYTDAYEMGYKKSWDEDFLGIDLFMRSTSKVVQTYTRTDTLNILYYTPENVGNSVSIGAELMTGVDIYDWWNLNFSSSLYYYKLDVDIDNNLASRDQLRADIRLNNTFNLPLAFTLEWDIHYYSPVVTAQSKREGYAYSDVSMKKSFKDNKWSLTLAFSNLFTGVRYYSTTKGDDFSMESTVISEPYATIKVAYMLNNQK